MYYTLLVFHSAVRWLVLISLLFTISYAFVAWKRNLPFKKFDNIMRHVTATIAHIQLLLGLCLYGMSPIVEYFFANIKEAIHERQIRFFGMEHITVMFISLKLRKILIRIDKMLTSTYENDDRFIQRLST